MNLRRDFRIPFFPCKFARPEESCEGNTECCPEIGGVETFVAREEIDDGDEEVRRERETFTVGFVAVDPPPTTDSEINKGVVEDL